MRFLVTGGRQKGSAHFKPEWRQHDRCLAFIVDLESGRVEPAIDYVTPPEACPEDDPAIQFKAGSIHDGELFLCTTTEILIYRLADMERVGYVSLPRFNDVHHVLAVDHNTMLVSVTGLDMMVEITRTGEVLREWNTLGEDPWARFDRETDYRRIATTKPHLSHPNYGFVYQGDYWATRFEQKDVVCLTGDAAIMPVGVERPHDGFVRRDQVWLTTVDGQVIVTRPGLEAPAAVHDLNSFKGAVPDKALGWCRGLHVVDDRRVVVGFSRLRPSLIRSNLRWIKHRFGARPSSGDLPTRIALYDLHERRVLEEVALESVGLSTVFSILSLDGESAP